MRVSISFKSLVMNLLLFSGGSFNETYRVFSFASNGRKDLEYGDKVILPSSAFKEVTRLRLPFPLFFEVKNSAKPRLSQSFSLISVFLPFFFSEFFR